MDDILAATICSQCNSIFQTPIILPCCSVTICQKHIPTNDTTLNCSSCRRTNVPIPQQGFAPNTAASILIKVHLKDFQRAGDACEQMRLKIEEFNSLKTTQSEDHIEKVIGEMESQIKDKREALIANVADLADKALAEFSEYKKECKLVSRQLVNMDDGGLEKKKEKLERYLVELRKMDFKNSAKYKKITEESEREVVKLNSNIETLKNMLLKKNKLNQYQTKVKKFLTLKISHGLRIEDEPIRFLYLFIVVFN
jgi:hypothetical protein